MTRLGAEYGQWDGICHYTQGQQASLGGICQTCGTRSPLFNRGDWLGNPQGTARAGAGTASPQPHKNVPAASGSCLTLPNSKVGPAQEIYKIQANASNNMSNILIQYHLSFHLQSYSPWCLSWYHLLNHDRAFLVVAPRLKKPDWHPL